MEMCTVSVKGYHSVISKLSLAIHTLIPYNFTIMQNNAHTYKLYRCTTGSVQGYQIARCSQFKLHTIISAPKYIHSILQTKVLRSCIVIVTTNIAYQAS